MRFLAALPRQKHIRLWLAMTSSEFPSHEAWRLYYVPSKQGNSLITITSQLYCVTYLLIVSLQPGIWHSQPSTPLRQCYQKATEKSSIGKGIIMLARWWATVTTQGKRTCCTSIVHHSNLYRVCCCCFRCTSHGSSNVCRLTFANE